MKKTIIFGAGVTGQKIYDQIKTSADVIGFLDNNQSRWNTKFNNIPVLGDASSLGSVAYDEIVIGSLPGLKVIREQLLSAGVPAEKIRSDYLEIQYNARINFLHSFAEMNKEIAKQYSVAEGGVFQGDFAKEINSCFPDSTLYLFDTFQGFDKRDVSIEETGGYSSAKEGHLNITSEELVLDKLPFKDKAVVRKGYFPETTGGLEKTSYFFVNLDFDLYNPTIAGLRFFVPRLASGGVILIHDYFHWGYSGIQHAVSDYEKECKFTLHKFPIGDLCSLGIMV